MLQLEFPLRPLILGLLSQQVDHDVTVGDGGRVCWPVMLTQHLGSEGQSRGGGVALS